MTNYTLVIVDSEGNIINQSSLVTTGRSLSLKVNRLIENSLYSYYIMATNRIGDSESTSINIGKYIVITDYIWSSYYHVTIIL